MRKRMTKLLGFILAVLAAAAFISCEEEIPFNGKYSGEKLVLFSTVNPDSGRIAVSVSSSRFFLDKDQNYQGRMVSGAIVTVKTDDGTLQLTEEPGTGLYSCPLSVREGERISINASHEGFADVSSTIEVPCRPDFEIVSRYSKIVEQEEKFRTVEWHFKIKVRDNPDRKEFYQFRISSNNSGQFTYTSDVAFMDTDDIEGIIEGNRDTRVERMIIDEGMLGSGERILDFWVEDFQRSSSLIYGENGPGDEVSAESPSSGEEEFISNLGSLSITVTGYSEDLYRYIKSLEAYSEFGGFNEIFGEPVCIHNNIENGIGCFGAIARRTLE